MCLDIADKHKVVTHKPEKVKKEIKVYKIVKQLTGIDPKRKEKKTFRSLVQNFKYELNKEYTAEFGIKNVGFNSAYVNQGLHAYTWDKIKKEVFFQGGSHVILECIIPVGAKMFYGINGDTVSTNLITKKSYKVNDFIKKHKLKI